MLILCLGQLIFSNCLIELSSETSNTIERKWGLSIFDKEDECVLIADVQYVHQLQNLLYTSTRKYYNEQNIYRHR